MGGKVGFCGMKKAPIRRVGAYERLSAARGISLASTHFIRARRGNKDSGLRAARLDRAGSQTRTRLSPAGGKYRFCSSGNPVFHVKHFPTAVAILTRCVIIIEHIKIGPNGAKAALRPGKGYANG